jgi:uncharacterized protein (DUF885 family)
MKKEYLYPIVLLLMMSCNSPSGKKEIKPDPKLASIFINYYEEKLKLFPMMATNIGDHRYEDQLPNNISENFRNELRQFCMGYLDSLKTINMQTLNDEDILSYKIMQWECNIDLEGLELPFNLLPIDQFWTLQIEIGRFAGGTSSQPFKTAADYKNWLKRLDAYITWCDTAIANMKKGIQLGYVLPKSLIIKVIPQFADFDHGPVEKHLFYQPVLNMPAEISKEDKEQIVKEYKIAIEQKIIPEYKKLHDFFQNEYLPAGRESSGCGAMPNGDKMYAYLIKSLTTTNLTADEIFEIGKKEVDRLNIELEKVKDSIGFKGTMIEFFNYIRNKKELMPYTNANQVIEHFNKIYNTIQPHLPLLFDKVPKTKFEIKRTETFREKTASADYQSGSVDGTRPGIFYVPIPDVSHYNIFSDEDVFLHEAIPGHHFQISLQQEDTTLPKFRQTSWNSAYGEGWALYCESLGQELGLYTDPYQYFGLLSNEMHRAIRLVVDVGMHAKGWTREQAIEYSLQHEAESESNIISEIERYMALPAQALSYKIGELKILELRAKAEKELGEKFDIREFHNKILESGCIPMALLEERINNWIEMKKR